MKRGLRKLRVKRFSGKGMESVEDVVAKEFPLTIVLNDEVLVNLVCFPSERKQLAIGYLFTERLISKIDDIKEAQEDNKRGIVWVRTKHKIKNLNEINKRRTITTGCGKGVTFQSGDKGEGLNKMRSDLRISPEEIQKLNRQLKTRSELYRETGCVHSAALCDRNKIIVYSEDIGRHNVIDKIIGKCLLEGIETSDSILIMSGRLSSEIILKAAVGGIPIVISRAAPTDISVKIAKEVDMTLIGFARGHRMNIYSGERRIVE